MLNEAQRCLRRRIQIPLSSRTMIKQPGGIMKGVISFFRMNIVILAMGQDAADQVPSPVQNYTIYLFLVELHRV
jgi:hypothetical protein